MVDEVSLFTFEMLSLLPYIYMMKLWQAHTEFMEDLVP